MALAAVVEGRRVHLFSGKKSQTVRVCDPSNRDGTYEWVVRVLAGAQVRRDEVADHGTIAGLIEWLRSERGGVVEADASETGRPLSIPPDRLIRPGGDDDPWIVEADQVVRVAIDRLLDEFVRAPYLHRVEHSLHTRLAALLTDSPLLGRECPLAGGTAVSQPVHKEWPETVPEEGTRRGNFDLAVLSPGTLLRATVEDFLKGYIEAPIVIEVGLDYGLAHLIQDVEKLLNSRVRLGYLVHFTRVGETQEVETFVSSLAADERIKVAYASFRSTGVRRKGLGDRLVPSP